MKFSIQIEQNHARWFQQFLQSRIEKRLAGSPRRVAWISAIWLLVIFTGIFLVEAFGGGFHRPSSAFFIVLFGAASIHYLAVLSRVREGFIPKPDGALLKQSTVTLGPDDVLIESGSMSTRYAWGSFVEIERAGGLIMLFIDDTAAVLLPEDQLDDPDQVYKRIAGRICGGA